MSDSPIFILANPRSGSSLFRLILNSTDKSIFPPECGFIQWLYPKYKNWNSDKLFGFVEDVVNSKKFEGWGLSYEKLSTFIHNSNPKSYADACYLVYKFYGMHQNKDIEVWGDKNNYYIHHLDTISEIYPNAKYIWLNRNPKDVCASYLKVNELPDELEYKPKVSNDIKEIFDEIKQNSNKIEYFLQKINKNNKLLVNFEDILRKNQKVLDKLSGFAGIDMNVALTNFDKKLYFDEPKITMAWKGKTKEVLDTNYIDTYKSHPKSNEIELIYKGL
jgi:hypothetical protein